MARNKSLKTTQTSGRMKNIKLAMTFTLASTLVGCITVGPDYQAPSTGDLSMDASLLTTVDTQQLEVNWWRQFNDPDLDKLVQAALTGSPSIAAAQARVTAARAVFDDTRDDLYPKGSVGLGYEAAEAPAAPDYDRRVKSDHFNTGLNAGWTLDLFGRVQRSIEAAEANAQSQEAALRNVQVEIVAAVVKSYGELRAAQHRVQVAEANLENLHEVLKLTQLRFETGVGSELDVARTQAEYAGNQASIPPLRAQIQRAIHRLQALTGQTPQQLDGLTTPKQIPAINVALPIGNPADLLQRRPAIQQAERELASATAEIGVATSDLFPQVEVSGFLGFISASGADLGTSASKAWSIAPTLKWQVLDLASLKARVRISEASAKGALANYHQQVLTALEETRNALVTYDQDQQRFRYLLAREKSSARAQALAQARYKAGVIDLLDVLDTERTRLSAEDDVAQAELKVFQGIAEIYRSLGGGWNLSPTFATLGNSAVSRSHAPEQGASPTGAVNES
ncbi:efflux transporter outer membrane subunit [Hahella ganghwensis]|uniref:efflux transporter outer membrane subunit n=1 Tax=Hahella ganghwensis TaxID=286420 RepID=UPI00037B1767|nr:TolC family protein [Hahella ganghwensis]